MGNRNPYLGTASTLNCCFFCIYVWHFLYLLSIFFNCAFYALYKENQGLEVPRETRLEKLMRLLEVSKKCMEEKPSWQQKPFRGCIFGLSQKWKKSRELRGLDLDLPAGGGFMTLRICFQLLDHFD